MEMRQTTQISRTPGVLRLKGIHAPSLALLQQTLHDAGASSELIAADLSLGAWRGNQVAAEFCTQLGLPPPLPQQVPFAMGKMVALDEPLPYADVIGAWIDAESGGDQTTLTALELATQVTTVARKGPARTFLVIAPRFDFSWENENILFLRFLAQGLHDSDSCMFVVNTDLSLPKLPDDWQVDWISSTHTNPPQSAKTLLDLIPGVLLPEVTSAVQSAGNTNEALLLPLPHGCVLTAPERRRGPRAASRFEYDKLAVLVQAFDWLKGYAQFLGNNLYVDPFFLCREAWRRFAEGGYAIALRLMERAIACASTLEQQGFFRAQAQGIRIGLQRFAEAAAEPDPSPALAPAVRGFLFQNKGWGLVMGDDPARAEPYFREARALLAPYYQQGREYLYLLNISALSCLERGDLDGALEIEREIAAQTAQQPERDWRLEYVNAINLARLYRRRADYHTAEECYRRAFATTRGARSESDSLYTNVCHARLYAQQGRPTEAFLAWLRAGLHWASSRTPEAIAPRVAKAIVGRVLPPVGDLPEAISSALFTSLLSSIKTSTLAPTVKNLINGSAFEKSPAPVFVRADLVMEETASHAITGVAGSPGWGVLTMSTEVPLQFTGVHHRWLRALLYEICRHLSPFTGWTNASTIIVDDQLGREIPETALEIITTGLRWNVSNIIWGDNAINLDRESHSRLKRALRVRLGDAVAKVEHKNVGDVIVFKRYLPPKPLSVEERQLILLLEDQPSVEDLWKRMGQRGSFDTFVSLVRALEQSRVLVLSLTKEAGVGVGIELPVEESHAR